MPVTPLRMTGFGEGAAAEVPAPVEELGNLKLWVGSWNLGAKARSFPFFFYPRCGYVVFLQSRHLLQEEPHVVPAHVMYAHSVLCDCAHPPSFSPFSPLAGPLLRAELGPQ